MTQKKSIELKGFSIKRIIIPISGISPLIVHAWSRKSIQMIQDKQAGKASNRKHELRNPEEEWLAARHISSQGWEGFPASGFKGAMIRGGKAIGMIMADLRGCIFVVADDPITQLVRINGASTMNTAMVRVGMGVADVRYRPEYVNWNVNLCIEYNEGQISLEQVHQLVVSGGYGCGIGEMRPEKGAHSLGRWTLATKINA